jgi:hypothetical protein
MNEQQQAYHDRLPERHQGTYLHAVTGRRALKAIRSKCLDCMCWQMAEVAKCELKGCPLWPYRMGRNAHRAQTKGVA